MSGRLVMVGLFGAGKMFLSLGISKCSWSWIFSYLLSILSILNLLKLLLDPEFFVTPKFGVLLQIQSFFFLAKHSEFTPKF